MATRKASLKDDETPAKRRRLDEIEPAACLDALNDDCTLHILSNLPLRDLNTFALVNSRYANLRNHESLDQTREAVIYCSRRPGRIRATRDSLNGALVAASRALNRNYTKLMIVGMETVESSQGDEEDDGPALYQLWTVTALELVPHQNESANLAYIHGTTSRLLRIHLPNVLNLTMRDAAVGITGRNLPCNNRLTQLVLKNCCVMIDPENDLGIETASEHGTRDYRRRHIANLYDANNARNGLFILCRCHYLEHLDMTNITWAWNLEQEQSETIAQGMLVKLARRLQTLRWLRCDLTRENVELLQRERPEVTFVSE